MAAGQSQDLLLLLQVAVYPCLRKNFRKDLWTLVAGVPRTVVYGAAGSRLDGFFCQVELHSGMWAETWEKLFSLVPQEAPRP